MHREKNNKKLCATMGFEVTEPKRVACAEEDPKDM
jgi:hypothetical protein